MMGSIVHYGHLVLMLTAMLVASRRWASPGRIMVAFIFIAPIARTLRSPPWLAGGPDAVDSWGR